MADAVTLGKDLTDEQISEKMECFGLGFAKNDDVCAGCTAHVRCATRLVTITVPGLEKKLRKSLKLADDHDVSALVQSHFSELGVDETYGSLPVAKLIADGATLAQAKEMAAAADDVEVVNDGLSTTVQNKAGAVSPPVAVPPQGVVNVVVVPVTKDEALAIVDPPLAPVLQLTLTPAPAPKKASKKAAAKSVDPEVKPEATRLDKAKANAAAKDAAAEKAPIIAPKKPGAKTGAKPIATKVLPAERPWAVAFNSEKGRSPFAAALQPGQIWKRDFKGQLVEMHVHVGKYALKIDGKDKGEFPTVTRLIEEATGSRTGYKGRAFSSFSSVRFWSGADVAGKHAGEAVVPDIGRKHPSKKKVKPKKDPQVKQQSLKLPKATKQPTPKPKKVPAKKAATKPKASKPKAKKTAPKPAKKKSKAKKKKA